METGYLINHAVSTTGEPRSRYALPDPDHSTGSDAAERHCQGRTDYKERTIGNKDPAKPGFEPCWTNEGKDKGELGTFQMMIIYLQASEEKHVAQQRFIGYVTQGKMREM